MEPMVSDPMARGAKPAATATAEPVEEPPGAYQGSACSSNAPCKGDESWGDGRCVYRMAQKLFAIFNTTHVW